MPRANRILTLAVSLCVMRSAAALEPKPQIIGNTMPGWEEKLGTGTWEIKDGVLGCTGKGHAWFATKAAYTDFILELEFKLPPGGNSGVFLRVGSENDPVGTGFEVQVLDDYDARYKDILPAQHCGSLYKIIPPSKEVLKKAGEWNHMRIMALGDYITVALNGETIVDGNGKEHPEILKHAPRGLIGLQNHSTGVWYRNIRLADLAADRAERAAWFRDAKFGMFVHWGAYAVIGHGEWVMKTEKIPSAEYEKLPPKLNPTAFDAAEWVGLAKHAGARYMVITSKHHDGFAMYDSKASDYNIVRRTPWKKDPMKPLADECAKQGIRFGFYHSILDWHHPDYAPVPEWDKAARASHAPDFDKYLDYMQAMVRELCTNYGPLACIWWDGNWDHDSATDRPKFAKVNAMVRELQPAILINNRAGIPEDFDTPEQYIPPTGVTNPDGTPKLWENCITLTTGHGSHAPTAWWGYDKNEKEFKTPEFCIRMLVDIVSKGGNLLLNVGPDPTGKIGPNETRVLEAMGRWLDKNGDAIYGTTASPFRYLPFFGKATVKDNRLFLHVFAWPTDGLLVVPGLRNEVRSAKLLATGETVPTERSGPDVVVKLATTAPDPIASVVVLQLDGPPRVEPMTIRPAQDGSFTLPALYAELRGQHGQRVRYETAGGQLHVGNWTNANDRVAWAFQSPAGVYEVFITYAAEAPSAGGSFEVVVGEAKVQAKVEATGETGRFATKTIGRLTLAAGSTTLEVRPVSMPKGAPLMNLREVALRPAK